MKIILMFFWHCDGNRPRGRPNDKWLDNIKEDRSDPEMTLYEATHLAKTNTLFSTGCQHAATLLLSPR